jgi:hypothetical protein
LLHTPIEFEYQYDLLGNATARQARQAAVNGLPTLTTRYYYDYLDRLDSVVQTGNGTVDQQVQFIYDGPQLADIKRYDTNIAAGATPVARTHYDYFADGRFKQLEHVSSQPLAAAAARMRVARRGWSGK